MRRRVILVVLVALAGVLLLAGGFALWGHRQLQASLPRLEGVHRLAGLSSEATVTRDALGIPVIRGRSREDVARATGFVHAQDRFFQMDLSRRRAAGELAALVGAPAVPLDLAIRVHRFRATAERSLSLMSPRDRRILEAYTAGVNAGLSDLGAAPFEYLMLRQDPEPWRTEDSLLVVLSMFIILQDADGNYESALATMHDVLPRPMFDFLASPGTEWDAPVTGERFSVPAIPGPEIYNLRARRAGRPPIELPPGPSERVEAPPSRTPVASVAALVPGLATALGATRSIEAAAIWGFAHENRARAAGAVGSNNWVVAGRLTPDGGALVANDMHLTVRVPNTWYRAMLEWPDPADAAQPHRLVGVTLPGFPALVVGSNTHVAWGFTNTYADWSDLVILEVDPSDPTRYRTPDGWRRFEQHDEVIAVAGEDDRHERIAWTIWGPVLGRDHRGRLRAYRWVAHSAERLATAATPLESVRSLEDVFEQANGLGTPGQNLVAADRSGRIGWTIYGSIPRRVGFDARLPASWADGSRGWHGWLAPSEYPRLIDPPHGRIWTANARVVGGEMLAALGDGSYEVGSRATIIRDRLMAQEQFTPADMLDIQLETSAVFLARWRDLILQALTPALVGSSRSRAELRAAVERDWTGEASPESAGYWLTRMFREQLSRRVMAFVLAECYEADPTFDHIVLRRREGAIWKLVTEQPMHLLDPQYGSWSELFGAAADAAMDLAPGDGPLRDRTWSLYNVSAYRHPLSSAVPFAGRWLDMPLRALPGDLYTPRVQWGAIAASERMVVSPGREARGFMHMPTGQSGHPLSPFYASSHEAWMRGEPSPFLPGKGEYALVLTP